MNPLNRLNFPIVALVLFWAASCSGETCYLSVGGLTDEEYLKATALAGEAQASNEDIELNANGRLLIGPFETVVQANRAAHKLALDRGADLQIQHNVAKTATPARLFPMLKSTDAEKLRGTNKQRFSVPKTQSEVQTAAERLELSNPERGYLETRLAYYRLRDKDYKGSAKHLENVVFGKVAAQPADLREAAYRLARTYHALGQKFDAFELLSELDASGTYPADLVVQMRVLKAAIAIELAEEGTSTFAEARELCTVVMQDPYAKGSELSKRTQSWCTAALMFVESYYFEGLLVQGAEQGDLYRKQLQNAVSAGVPAKRELAVLSYFLGRMYYELGKPETAKPIFEQLSTLSLSEKDNFAGFNPQMRASFYQLAISARARGWKPGLPDALTPQEKANLATIHEQYRSDKDCQAIEAEVFGTRKANQ